MSPVRRHTEYLEPLYRRPLMRFVNSQQPATILGVFALYLPPGDTGEGTAGTGGGGRAGTGPLLH